MNVSELLQEYPAIERVKKEILYRYAAGISVAEFLTLLSEEVPEDIEKIYRTGIEKLSADMPLQYITNIAPFFGRDFIVTKDVLIPRFDTEILVENVLSVLPDENLTVLDLCTGSGCIGITLKAERPKLSLLLSDISPSALKVAEENALKHGVEVDFRESDLFSLIPGKFNAIVSNPPYVRESEWETLFPEVRLYEPKDALNGGSDGLSFYRRIIPESKNHLTDSGFLFLEIGDEEGLSVAKLMNDAGFTDVRIISDLTKRDRVVTGCLKK